MRAGTEISAGERATRVTDVLDRVGSGDDSAAEELLPLVYEDLRRRAGRLMAWERADHTLQRTALVHEAYVRLVRPGASFKNRLHFMNAAAQAMRRILMDHAEARSRQKRGGGLLRVRLEGACEPTHSIASTTTHAVALDSALARLSNAAPRQAQVVMLRFFAGRSESEIARMLEVSEKTVRRDWQAARLWLYDRLRSNTQ